VLQVHFNTQAGGNPLQISG